jgi:hypothetical protein
MANGTTTPTANGRFVINFKRGSIQSSGLVGLFDIDAWASIDLSFNGKVSLPFAGSWELGLVQYLFGTIHRQQYDNGGFIFLTPSSGFWLDTLDNQPDVWITPPGEGVFSKITSGPFIINPTTLRGHDDPALVGVSVLASRARCSNRVSETLLWVYHNMFFRAFVVARVGGQHGTAFPLLMSDIYGFELLFDATHQNDSDQDPYLTYAFTPAAGPPRSIQPSEFLAFSPYNALSLAPPDPSRANSVLGPLYTQAVRQYLGDCNTYRGPFDPASMGIKSISLPAGK